MKEVKYGSLTTFVVKTTKEFTEIDRKKYEKNYKAKKILVCGIGADEYNRSQLVNRQKRFGTVFKLLMKEPRR